MPAWHDYTLSRDFNVGSFTSNISLANGVLASATGSSPVSKGSALSGVDRLSSTASGASGINSRRQRLLTWTPQGRASCRGRLAPTARAGLPRGPRRRARRRPPHRHHLPSESAASRTVGRPPAQPDLLPLLLGHSARRNYDLAAAARPLCRGGSRGGGGTRWRSSWWFTTAPADCKV